MRRLAEDRPTATWVHAGPIDAIPDVARRCGVPESVVRHLEAVPAVRQPHRPRLLRLPNGARTLTCPTISYEPAGRSVSTGAFTCLRIGDLVLTAEDGDAGIVDDLADRLVHDDRLPSDPRSQVFAAVIVSLVSTAADIEVAIGEAVGDAEVAVFTVGGASSVELVYGLKREIAEARRALAPLLTLLPDLVADQEDGHGEGYAGRWLHRLDLAADRVDRHLDAHDALLADLLTVHLSRQSVQQNDDMRRISAWAAIIAVPTLVAGVYGMNFRHMPELMWVIGYPLSLLLMIGSALALYLQFRRSGWWRADSAENRVPKERAGGSSAPAPAPAQPAEPTEPAVTGSSTPDSSSTATTTARHNR